jgi:hypothetical protein
MLDRCSEIELHAADFDAQSLGIMADEVGNIRTMQQRFAGDAPDIHTYAAQFVAFDHGCVEP